MERGWGFDRCDAKRHSLFPAFQRHLAGHACWEALDAIHDYLPHYESACLQAHAAVLERAKQRVPSLTESDARAMAGALLTDAYYRTGTSSATVVLMPRPHRAHYEEGIRWHLQAGSAAIRHAEDPTKLQPLVAAYAELAATLPSTEELRALGEAGRVSRRLIEEFRATLSSDARLRKLVLDGRCDLCS